MAKRWKELTKQMLIDRGITVLDQKDANGNYIIMRTGKKSCNSKVTTFPLSIVLEGKYCDWSQKWKYYYRTGFNYNGKTESYSVSRIYYAWFKGDVPEGYEVDHIIDEPINNDISNLKLLTPPENRAKRRGYKNQYQTPKWKLEHKKDKDDDVWYYDDEEGIAYTDEGPISYSDLK